MVAIAASAVSARPAAGSCRPGTILRSGWSMISNNALLRAVPSESLPNFLTVDDWQYIVLSLQLSPQQARIVSLILQGKQDKEMAAELGLNRYTIRTYLRRVFDREGLEDRMDLVLHIFGLCSHRRHDATCPLYG